MIFFLFLLSLNAQAEPIAYGQLHLTGWRAQISGDFTFGNRFRLGNEASEISATTGVSLTPNQADSQANLTIKLPVGFLFEEGRRALLGHFGFGTSLVDYDHSDAGYGTNLGLLTYVENTNRRSSGEEWSLGLTSGWRDDLVRSARAGWYNGPTSTSLLPRPWETGCSHPETS